ncbi:hypothetical protein ABFX02_14G185000 [Erythranthe guttata]
MAAQSFLVQNLVLQQRSHPHLFHHHHHHRRHPPPPQFRPSQTVNLKNIPTKTFKNLIVESFSLNNNNVNRRSNNGDSNQDINYKIKFPNLETKQNPKRAVEAVSETLINAVKALRKPAAAAAAVILLGLLLSVNPNNNHALAASGNSSSRYSSSTSLAAPPPSSPPSTYDVMKFIVVSLMFLVLVGAAYVWVEVWCYINKESVTVVKLQVGLLGLGRSLQKDINRIAEPVDVSTSEGLHYILTELVVALLRYPENCASAFLTIDQEWDSESAQQKFYQHSMEERVKFDEEKLVNVNNIKRQSPITTTTSSGFSNDYIVLTILVKAQGVLQLPRIKNSNNLKEVLRKLAYLPISKILEVKIIWNPQIEDDTLSEEELIRNYPLLRPLQ